MRARQLELVMKVSKLCNMRCTYCYEFNELANPRRMALNTVEGILRNIAGYCEANDVRVLFIWHGGEPLLVKPSYYEQIGELQRAVLGGRASWWNAAQTNLTVLTERLLDFLARREFFTGIGVSVDPFGNERVDVKGRPTNEVVFDNMQILIDRQIPFGAITVLTRSTLPYLARTLDFFDRLAIGFRALPFYLSASPGQIDRHALRNEEVVGALVTLFDLWLGCRHPIPIDPLREYVRFAISYLRGDAKVHKDMWLDETVFIVDMDGNIWGESGEYEASSRYGNLADQEIEAILNSESRRLECDAAAARVETCCTRCPYYGHCPGDYVIYATAQQRRVIAEIGCPVRKMLDHIVKRFDQTLLSDDIRTLTEAASAGATVVDRVVAVA